MNIYIYIYIYIYNDNYYKFTIFYYDDVKYKICILINFYIVTFRKF